MAELFTNNARTVLAFSLADVDTSLSVQTGNGAKFPSLPILISSVLFFIKNQPARLKSVELLRAQTMFLQSFAPRKAQPHLI